jgi:hypothetical protein
MVHGVLLQKSDHDTTLSLLNSVNRNVNQEKLSTQAILIARSVSDHVFSFIYMVKDLEINAKVVVFTADAIARTSDSSSFKYRTSAKRR